MSTHGTNVSNLTVNEELSTSDHSIIEFCVPIGVIHKRRKVLVRNLLKADWSLFRSQLASLDVCKQIFESVDIDECWCNFVTALKLALDSVAPLKLVTLRNYVSCSKVRTALRYKRRCFRALIQERSLSNVAAYERSAEIAQCAITNDTNKRENYIINNTDPKSFWTYVNRRQSKHPVIIAI